MRDGNPAGMTAQEPGGEVVSLPMRDGNLNKLFPPGYDGKLLAYL